MLFFNSDCINIIWSRSRSSHKQTNKQTIITIHIHLKKNMLSREGIQCRHQTKPFKVVLSLFLLLQTLLSRILHTLQTVIYFLNTFQVMPAFLVYFFICSLIMCKETNLLSKGSSINDVMQNRPLFSFCYTFLILRL
jgi:hypothetical protein